MRTLLALLAAVCLLSTSLRAGAEERIGLDPVLTGVWMSRAISFDEGKTVETDSGAFAQATTGRVLLSGHPSSRITKVVIQQDDSGNDGNVFTLEDFPDTIFAVWQMKDNKDMFLLQWFQYDDQGELKETFRVVFEIE